MSQLTFTNITPELIKQHFELIVTKIKAVHDSVATSTSLLSFESVLRPFLNAHIEVAPYRCLVQQMHKCHPDADVRKASLECDKQLSAFDTECDMRGDVYQVFAAYYQSSFPREKAANQLTAEEVRLVERWHRNYRRRGLHLSSEIVAQVKDLRKQIDDVCISYRNNLSEDTTRFTMSADELRGLPASWFHESKRVKSNTTSEDETGKQQQENKTDTNETSTKCWVVTLKYPDLVPILRFCSVRQTRKKMYCAFWSLCQEQNGPLMDELVFLRDRLARLLGYASYAAYALEIKMAQTTQRVDSFLNDLVLGFEPLIQKEYRELSAFAQQHRLLVSDDNVAAAVDAKTETTETALLQRWDLWYVQRLFKEAKFDVKMDDIRQYFPLERVTKGMLEIYQRLLSLRFVEVKTDNVWHPSVRLFHVFENNNKTPDDHKTSDDKAMSPLGMFYLDLFPRPGKYNHACVCVYLPGCLTQPSDASSALHHQQQPHVVTMLCNFPEHECLEFSDVVTLFHEFGHAMHFVCSKTQLAAFGGAGVEGDFVEAPSQMLEYWCYTQEALNLLSGHRETGQPLPRFYVDKLEAMERADAGFANRRQLVYATVDMALHSRNYQHVSDVGSRQLFLDAEHKLTLLPTVHESNPAANFAHLAGNYGAGYYGYLMSETYAADMFYTKFAEEGQDEDHGRSHVLDPERGLEYRKAVLEPGSSLDGMDLIKRFLGREPILTPFLKDKGLLVASKAETE